MTSYPAPMVYRQAEPTGIDRFLTDDRWVLEQKLDGIRLVVDFTESGPRPRSKSARALRTAERLWRNLEPVLAASPILPGVTLDGELLPDGTWWVFDVPAGGGGAITPATPFGTRREFLTLLYLHLTEDLATPGWGTQVRLVEQATTTTAKRALWRQVLLAPAEGVVAKRLTGHYRTDGHPSNDIVKVKVTHTVDAVITARNVDGKTNAELALVDDDGTEIPVGSTSMYGKPDLPVGAVIEVRYLSIGSDGKLVQPRMVRPRPDKDRTQVPPSQLTFTDPSPIGAAA